MRGADEPIQWLRYGCKLNRETRLIDYQMAHIPVLYREQRCMDWNFILGTIAAGGILIGGAMLMPGYNAWLDRQKGIDRDR